MVTICQKLDAYADESPLFARSWARTMTNRYYLSEVGRVRSRNAMFYSKGGKKHRGEPPGKPRRSQGRPGEPPKAESKSAAKKNIDFVLFLYIQNVQRSSLSPIPPGSRPDPDYPVTVKK